MEATRNDSITKLIKLYTSGQSLNAADGKYLQHKHGLPGQVLEESVEHAHVQGDKSQDSYIRAEKEKQQQRTEALLHRQREANTKEKIANVNEKVNYSAMKSEVNLESARSSTVSIAATISRCSKIILQLDNNCDAASDMPSIVDEDYQDFQSSIQTLFSVRRVAKAAVQRARPVKKLEQQKREFFVKEVAQHLRSTTKAKTWSEWELDENFDVFCDQVRSYETEQISMRWLACEDRAWDTAKMIMQEERSSSAALSFSQARAILVEKMGIRLEKDEIMNLLTSSQDGSISRAQHIRKTYRRLAGPTAYSKSYDMYETKREVQPTQTLQLDMSDEKPIDEAEQLQENDETLAKLLLQRTVNQVWKKRFAEMMESLDAKDVAKRKQEKKKFLKKYIQKAQETYNLGSNKFAQVLRTHSPEFVESGCSGPLKRFWNNLMVSGTVLDQLVNDCENFVLVHYCKKIQKQWRNIRIRRHFEAVLSKSKYLSSLTQKGKLWKEQIGHSLSISGRIQMRDFRYLMKGQRTPGLLDWDQEFAQASTDDVAGVNTLYNRVAQLKSRKQLESSSRASMGSNLFNEHHPRAAKWSLQSQYYEIVPAAAWRIQRFWRSVCKRRAFFVSIRYVAAYCILRWMLSKLKGQNGQTNGELHGIHLTANYAKEAAHLAHLIFEKNSLRYQLEGTTLIQNRRKFLANDLHILQKIQEYQSHNRFRLARNTIGVSDGLRVAALQENTKADESLNNMIRAENIRQMPRPTIPAECVSHPVGPEADGRHIYLLQTKLAARQMKEHQRKLFKWNELQASSEGQAGLSFEQKLAATAIAMQLSAKSVLVAESHDRFAEDGVE